MFIKVCSLNDGEYSISINRGKSTDDELIILIKKLIDIGCVSHNEIILDSSFNDLELYLNVSLLYQLEEIIRTYDAQLYTNFDGIDIWTDILGTRIRFNKESDATFLILYDIISLCEGVRITTTNDSVWISLDEYGYFHSSSILFTKDALDEIKNK